MEEASKFRRIRFQFQASLSCMFAMMSAGNVIGWMSPAVVYLRYNDNHLSVSPNDLSWMSSLIFIGIIIGPIIFAFIVDKVGRKWINFFASALYIVGWSFSIIPSSVSHLLISRFILGIGMGFTFCIAPIYTGEIIEKHLRGAFSAALVAKILVGFLYVFVLAPFVGLKFLSLTSLLFPFASLLTFFLMPESPHFHVMNNKFSEAEKNLMRLRGETNKINIIEELAEIIEFLEDGFTREPFKTKLKIFQFKKAIFPLLITTVLIFTQTFSGVFSLTGNIHMVINDTVPETDNEFYEVIIAICIGLFVSLCTLFFIDRIGRRLLFFISSGGCMMSTLAIGFYYYLQSDNSLAWITIVGVFSFQFFFYAGLGCIPYAVGSEIFPAYIRPWTTAFMVMILGMFGFASSKMYYNVGNSFGYQYSFWSFSCATFLGAIFIYFYMPETKQKTFIEIQELLNSKISSSTKSELNDASPL